MREIKFRAWATVEKKMHYNTYFDNLEVWEWSEEDGQMVIIGDRREDSMLHQAIIMQFTGLHDKNGKEIYEGDILKIEILKCQFQKATLIGTVVFQYSSFGVEIKQIAQWEGYSEFASRPNVVWLLNIIDNKEFEVIGNIYENPELLEAK